MLNIEGLVGDLEALLKAPEPLRVRGQLGAGTGSPLESFLLVLKPECFGDEPTFRTVLKVVHRCLTEQGVAITAYAFANQPLIEQENLIDRLYPILATLACLKEEDAAFSATMDWLRGCLGGHVRFMSATSYLEKYGIAPIVLHERSNGQCRKIGAGTYLWEDKDRGVWVMNPFFPHQKQHLARGPVLGLRCRASQVKTGFRDRIVGSVLPDHAHDGSIRRVLLAAKGAMKGPPVSLEYNYVHISPNFVESPLQIAALFGDPDDGLVNFSGSNPELPETIRMQTAIENLDFEDTIHELERLGWHKLAHALAPARFQMEEV